MENQQQLLIETQFEGLTLYVRPHETHEWLMETRLVAEGYGVSESTIRDHKRLHKDELTDGKHFIGVENTDTVGQGGSLKTFWTKRGVIRLGFFIKSARAKLFRDWAEDLIIRELEKNKQTDKVDLLEAKMHQYMSAMYEMLQKKIDKNHIELTSLIHNLSNRVDKLEKFMLFPHQLEEQKSYMYLFRKIGTNEYKIGKSNDPLDRIRAFENAGTDTKLILTIEFPNEAMALLWERTLQKTFKDLNLKGEWFLFSPQEVELLRGISVAFNDFYEIKKAT